MGLTDWMGTFGKAQALDLSNDLERAYEAALLIQSLELEYYNDRPVRPELELSIPRSTKAQMLRRFRAALQVCRQALDQLEPRRQEFVGQELRQLQLIEAVTARYLGRSPLPSISRSPDMLPRSLLGVFDGVRRQLDPEAEATVVAGFRRRRDSTLVSLRILLLLILVPVLVQQVSRTYVISPLVDRLAPDLPFLTYPRPQLEEEAAKQLRLYQSEIEFDALLRGAEIPNRDELRSKLAEKASELKEEADSQSSDAIKNIIADGAGLLGFLLVCLFGRQELRVLRGFLDEVIYGLSDSAKAFAIILFTDIFVGFHSPEGWTVLLGGIAHHFGLPAEENFVLLFIATFPVILATIFKYWIFRYLNRVSPSSVATLRNMNGGG
ncbi:proton extrusion protein PcxA [Cyanobium sp. Morenito 9A2]|uniref:proton extrusion protein PcxA n=1 Tax=Cyanobium sp. Morenito 9A2 TaxID=2823718 RepID=UPI0020CD81A8|nr:proton extrusion protein PcxA [Cyanobium sp. Morenito 9A2]MCP9850567.1 proton extrusion protein PcxA [Cyanobium sp. Morenito 9A2]